MESITHINNALQASLTTRNQGNQGSQNPVNKVDYQLNVTSIKDRVLDSLKENNQITIITNFLVPLFLVYLIYLSGSRGVYTQIIKYMLIFGCLKYLYKYIKKEPHPSDKNKENGHISLLYAFVIFTILTLIDFKIINFGNINIFNVSFSLSLIFAFVSIIAYGYGLLYTKSHYSTDLITTLLLSYLFYKSNLFYFDESQLKSYQTGGYGIMHNETYRQSYSPPSPTKHSYYSNNTELDFA